MTTSLPTTPASNELPTGAPASLAGDLAALLAAPAVSGAPTAGVPADAAANARTPEFTALLDGSTAATTAPAAVDVNTPASALPIVSPSQPTSPLSKNAPRSTVTTRAPFVAETRPTSTTDARGMVLAAAEETATQPASASAPSAQPRRAEAAPLLPDRSTLEAVIALLVPIAAAAVAPEQPTVALGAQPATAEKESGFPNDARVTLSLPGQAPVTLDETLSPARPVAEPLASEVALPRSPVAELKVAADVPTREPSNVPTSPSLAPVSPPREVPEAAASACTPVADATPEQHAAEVSASAELPDGSVVTFALPTAPARPKALVPVATARMPQPENSAAASAEKTPQNFAPETSVGKNFLSPEEQELSPAREEAGIRVAQTRSTMLFTPHDTLSAVQPTVPALVTMVTASQPAAAAPAPEPLPPLVAASLAHRAVDTVTNVVDAQAASKLQPVPAVQLKFKFGSEDLAVRVELRAGVVRTEFRTDSPELRVAIQNEWKAVTAQSESALRFLDPVVAPATPSSAQSGTNSFAQQQHPQSQGESAAQQQNQQQQSRAAAEFFGSVARSTPFQPREGGAASNVAPMALPTSLHLSAVA